MREMILARKQELEKRGVKGFTLMEMLIVIAIIAVLIAIAIPTFSFQLENARETTDAANIRSAYAECLTAYMTGQTQEQLSAAGSGVTVSDDGSYSKTVTLTQTNDTGATNSGIWSNADLADSLEAAGISGARSLSTTGSVTVTVNSTGQGSVAN